MSIEIKKIVKKFGNFTALDDINLIVPAGGLMAILGPSGSGKSTLLRIIAGLEIPDSGSVHFYGEDTTNKDVRERNVGFVFQHYALFKHMSVFDNIAFGLKVRQRKIRPSKDEIRDKVFDLLKLVQLEPLADRYPSELSGGQRQRVALARVLAVEPKMLLLDEPFGALDARVRKELRRWLRQLHDKIHITSVFVTHDQDEALEVSDSIVVMNEGRIEQVGTPHEVYNSPKTPFVLNFLGSVNLFKGRIFDGKFMSDNFELDLPGKEKSAFEDSTEAISSLAGENADRKNAIAYVRSHELDVDKVKKGKDSIEAIVERVYTFGLGHAIRLDLKALESDEMIEAEISRLQYDMLNLIEGDKVFVMPTKIKVFPEDYSYSI